MLVLSGTINILGRQQNTSSVGDTVQNLYWCKDARLEMMYKIENENVAIIIKTY